MANRAAGKGYENTEFYTNVEFQFLGIENIHVMRQSLQKLVYGKFAVCIVQKQRNIEQLEMFYFCSHTLHTHCIVIFLSVSNALIKNYTLFQVIENRMQQ